ncbi:MAG: hypothetical protein ACLS37_11770 [Alistipes sp.]
MCEQMDIASLKGIEHSAESCRWTSPTTRFPMRSQSRLWETHPPRLRPQSADLAQREKTEALRELKANDCFYQDEYGKAISHPRSDRPHRVRRAETLNIEDNSIAVLDLPIASPQGDSVRYNDLTTIDFSSCTKMTAITCRNNPLHGLTLDVSMSHDLLYLACWEAGLAGWM